MIYSKMAQHFQFYIILLISREFVSLSMVVFEKMLVGRRDLYPAWLVSAALDDCSTAGPGW